MHFRTYCPTQRYVIIMQYNQPSRFIVKRVGGSDGLKKLSFAVVNNLSHVAQYLPRLPDQDLATYLRREGSKPSPKATFRPSKVNAGLKFLLENNPHYEYYNQEPERVRYFPSCQGVTELESIEMNGEDDAEVRNLLDDAENLSTMSTSEGDLMLLHNDADLLSREEHMLELMGLKENETRKALNKPGAQVLYVPRMSEFKSPKTDPCFYEKAFPHLFPYGRGTFNGHHGLSNYEFLKLQLMRGGDRRFGTSPHFIFAKYSEWARNAAGQVAYVADQHAEASHKQPSDTNTANQDGSAPSPSGGSDQSQPGRGAGVKMNDPISELLACPTAAAMVDTLEKNDGAHLKKLLNQVEAFSSGLQGSALHIALERKSLFAMLLSPVVNEKGLLTVFGTFSPCDRFNSELYNAIDPLHTTRTKTERANLLRQHPVLAARVAEARVRHMFNEILEGLDMPFGEISDFWIRTEFQGTLH